MVQNHCINLQSHYPLCGNGVSASSKHQANETCNIQDHVWCQSYVRFGLGGDRLIPLQVLGYTHRRLNFQSVGLPACASQSWLAWGHAGRRKWGMDCQHLFIVCLLICLSLCSLNLFRSSHLDHLICKIGRIEQDASAYSQIRKCWSKETYWRSSVLL